MLWTGQQRPIIFSHHWNVNKFGLKKRKNNNFDWMLQAKMSILQKKKKIEKLKFKTINFMW